MSFNEVLIPDIGDFNEVEVIEILVAVGDRVAQDDPLVTLETDKAAMEIPSPAAGVVAELNVKAGDKVSEGSTLLLLNEDAESAESAESVREGKMEVAVTAAAEVPAVATSVVPAAAEPVVSLSSGTIHASPSIRKMARMLDVDLSQVKGTGHKGRLTRQDLEAFVRDAGREATAVQPKASVGGIPPIPAVDFSKFGPVIEEPLTRIQKISGPHLHRSWLNVPMVTHHDEADITQLEIFRKSLRAEADQKGIRVTALAFIMRSVAQALKEFPRFNASLSATGESLIMKQYYHVGIAVDTPGGLVVPVIRDVDQKSIYELSQEVGEVSHKAREGKLMVKDLQGGCMSISSLGGIGGTAFTPLVNAPEVAILGVTRSKMKPVWDGEEFEPRLMLPLDLTYDHRVIDGAEAARFMAYLCDLLSDVRRLLL